MPGLDDFVNKDWDSPEIEALAECTLAWYMGLRYDDFAEGYTLAEPPQEPPSRELFDYAARFEGYINEFVARGIVDMMPYFDKGGITFKFPKRTT